ncbi:MAG: polysaccharide biosynthesis tyrosine autokinase [Pirellulales bacterium]
MMISKQPETVGQRWSDPDSDASGSAGPLFLLTVGKVVWRRKWLVALGLVVGLLTGGFYYTQCVPIYESAAQVLVVKKRPEVIVGQNAHLSHFEDYVDTHRTLIQSPLIIDRAVKQGNLAALVTFAGEERPLTEAVIDSLSVDPVSQSSKTAAESILALSYRGKVAEECPVITEAILASYRQFLDETYRDMSDDTAKLISEARDILQKDLAAQEAGYREFRQTSPLIRKGAEDVNPRQERLTRIEAERSQLLFRKAELEANLATLESATKSGLSARELIVLASDLANQAEHSTQPDERVTLESQLLPLLVEEQRLLQDLGPNHPHVQSVRKQIAATRDFFALPSGTYNRLTERPSRNGNEAGSAEERVQLYVQDLQQELEHVRQSDESLAALYQREHQAAREIANYQIRDDEYRRGIERTQALYDGIVKQLHDASMVKQYGGFEARIIAPPGIGKKVLPNAMTVFPVSGLLGVLFGLVLVRAVELMDRRFRTPQQVGQELGLPVFGHIPWFEVNQSSGAGVVANGRSLAPVLSAYHRPRSPESEAYRALRTVLLFSGAAEGNRVIQITSPNSGAGKTVLVANVAISMAQSGKKVLLIDAELRKPEQHRLFGISGKVGLASVIAQDVEIHDAVQDVGIANLWLLPCGLIPPDPAELLTSPRFSELIAVVRETYDYVLLDSPPVLAVTDPCVVGARVDGVLLTLHISKDSREHAERAEAILSATGANVLGVVVNGVPQDDTEYGYSYGYGGGYGNSQDQEERTGRSQALSPREGVLRR